MDNQIISVVIPTSDARENYLRRAVASVARQDYRPLEVIIVVDGTSPAVQESISRLELDIPCTVMETGEKVGGSEARNTGVRNAKGAYIALLDDDDEWYTDKLSSQMALLQKERLSEADDFLCFTSLHRYKEVGQPVYDKLPNEDYADSGKKRLIDYLFETRGVRNVGFIQTSTVLVPRRLLLETPFTKGLPKHQDWDWLIKMDSEHDLKIVQVKEPKIIYHSDIPAHKRVGYINRWRFTEEWGRSHKEAFSKKGYEMFLLNYVIMGIASDRSLGEKEKSAEIRKRLRQLSPAARMSPYALKMKIYRMKERRSGA